MELKDDRVRRDYLDHVIAINEGSNSHTKIDQRRLDKFLAVLVHDATTRENRPFTISIHMAAECYEKRPGEVKNKLIPDTRTAKRLAQKGIVCPYIEGKHFKVFQETKGVMGRPKENICMTSETFRLLGFDFEKNEIGTFKAYFLAADAGLRDYLGESLRQIHETPGVVRPRIRKPEKLQIPKGPVRYLYKITHQGKEYLRNGITADMATRWDRHGRLMHGDHEIVEITTPESPRVGEAAFDSAMAPMRVKTPEGLYGSRSLYVHDDEYQKQASEHAKEIEETNEKRWKERMTQSPRLKALVESPEVIAQCNPGPAQYPIVQKKKPRKRRLSWNDQN